MDTRFVGKGTDNKQVSVTRTGEQTNKQTQADTEADTQSDIVIRQLVSKQTYTSRTRVS